MNVFLWILQIVLAGAFGMAGLLKLIRPKEKLTDNMAWAEDFTPGMIKFIGGAELLGALGLIHPAVTGIATVLTPLAATGLVIVMIGAVVTHVRRKELPMVAIPAVLLILAAVVAWGRFGPSPL
jgi:protein-S-isoprenylcysteine O-methyltransferase Ste14